MPAGRPMKYEDPKEFSDRIAAYFTSDNEPWTVTGLCVWLDTYRDLLIDYAQKPEYSDAVKRAKQKIEAYAEKRLYGAGNPAGIIFSLKNNFKWVDRQEIENTNYNIETTEESLLEKLKNIKENA